MKVKLSNPMLASVVAQIGSAAVTGAGIVLGGVATDKSLSRAKKSIKVSK